jgi:signal transduction histidine kinase/CheY-like chemotaxis protein
VLRWRIGLRWVVVALTLSIVAPLGVLSAVSLQRAWKRQLANFDRQNVATARAISVAIDNEVETTTAALDVFTVLHAFDSPDFTTFDSLARRLIVTQPDWSALVLADAHDTVVAAFPSDGDDAATAPASGWARTVITTGHSFVSQLFEAPGGQVHFVMIAVPVRRNGVVRFALGARVRSEAFGAVLRRQEAPSRGVVALVDAGHRVVARSTDDAAFVGTTVTAEFIDVSSQTNEGAWAGVGRDGVPNYAAFSRSPRTGLIAALALPRDEIDGPLHRLLWILAGFWALILASGAGVGLLFGREVVNAMRSASRAAMALARAEPVDPVPSRIIEIDELGTGLRHASGMLQERNRERDEASRLKDEFLMTVSHELRTPLTAIYGWARMLSTGEIREAQRTRAVSAIERNAKALEQLVNDLLDVSRVVTGKMRLDVQPIAVGDVVALAIDAMRPAAVAKNIRIALHQTGGEPTVSGDARRLQQVIWNLLSNAVRFTPNDGRIEVDVTRQADLVIISVRDTGPGIDPAFLPHAFERFRQGMSGTTRAHGGLGLGLAIARHLTELHGGTIRAENNSPAPGAAFHVALPARPELRPLPEQPAELTRLDSGVSAARLDHTAILVADDDLNARELLVTVLEGAGAEVRAAASAEDALMILDSWSPGVLLSDIEMPGEDGYTLMRRVRALTGPRSGIVAIALTAHARPEDRVKALEAGFHWHMAKPIEPSELVSVIATLTSTTAPASREWVN